MPLTLDPADLSVSSARLPFAEQIAFFRGKLGRLVPTRVWTDIQKSAHDTAFMVAGAMKADLLADLARAVDSAIAGGTSLDEFRRQFDGIVERHGWAYRGPRDWRTRVIYRTNVSTSYAAGRLAQLRASGLPYWMYKHSDAVTHPRPVHLSWDGLTLPADHEWFKSHGPPNGWGCQCRLVAVSSRTAKRLGGRVTDTPPDNGTTPTGRPNGIDDGWDYLPGDTVSADLGRLVAQKAGAAMEPLGAALLSATNRELARPGGAFAQWVRDPNGDWPLVRLPDADAQAIGATDPVGRLSATTARKQGREHPELTAEEYAAAQDVIDGATAKAQDTAHTLIYVREHRSSRSGGYVLVVKATRTGRAVFVTSYRRLSREQAQRDTEIARLMDKAAKK